MTWLKSEEEVEQVIKEMVERTKGKYITQGVSFNKTCPRQMEMLKMALMSSASFSGLIKELLALRMRGEVVQMPPKQQEMKPKNKNVGNFF
jgi:predicted CopG family antitoxin